MKISVNRSGGFAGLSEDLGSVDTTALPPADGHELEALVEKTGVLVGHGPPPAAAVGADMYVYALTVVDGARHTTWRFTDDGTPNTAALVELAQRVAKLR